MEEINRKIAHYNEQVKLHLFAAEGAKTILEVRYWFWKAARCREMIATYKILKLGYR